MSVSGRVMIRASIHATPPPSTKATANTIQREVPNESGCLEQD